MSVSKKDLTSRVCERIVEYGARPLQARALANARQLFLDGVAVAVAGAQLEKAPRVLLEHVLDPVTGAGENPAASVLGLNTRIGTVQAALVNGASMHVLDFEPMWLPATHALSPALAPALALGETIGASGIKILKAMVLGIEMQGRLRAATLGPPEEVSFHPPGFLGPIGAAVAAGHLLDFNAAQFANAIGIAGSRCGGLFVNLGTMTKSSHCGYAAALGLEAALLTRRGFTGYTTLFDPGPQSYAEAFFPHGFDGEGLMNFGEPFRIEDPGYAIKMFPAKFSTHYAITAALQARPRLSDAAAIRTIRITAADVPSSDRPYPRSGLDGKFSLQYTTALALLDGRVDFESFTDDRHAQSDVQNLLGKIETTLSRDIPGLYTAGRYLDLEIEMENGEVIRERCDRPRGAWGSEPITAEEHLGKARSCLATYLTPDCVEACIKQIQQIDTLDAGEVRALLQLVSTREAVACS
jgi:2-methylcitrate dehydratase PrpD